MRMGCSEVRKTGLPDKDSPETSGSFELTSGRVCHHRGHHRHLAVPEGVLR